MNLSQFCENNISELKQHGLFRTLRDFKENRSWYLKAKEQALINFSSNDYLGFRSHPSTQEASIQACKNYGSGTGASRLVSGNSQLLCDLENTIAEFKHTEKALVFSSGYATNVGVLQALMQKGDLIICDKWNHASIFDGCRLSEASFRTFAHKNYQELREMLLEKREKYRNVLLVTDSVFSMDGDLADLNQLVQIKKEFNGWLMIDEAHGTGVLGPNGQGLAHLQQIADEIDIHMGTLSKAIGSQGGFVAGSQILIQYLMNYSRSFIFSTGLNPAACGAAMAAFQILKTTQEPLLQLRENCLYWESLTGLKSPTPIYPIIIGSTETTLKYSEKLYEKGFFLQAIRPPTVPTDTARLRITINANHQKEHILQLAQLLQEQKLLV